MAKDVIKALTEARKNLRDATGTDGYEDANEAVVDAEKDAGPFASMRGWKFR